MRAGGVCRALLGVLIRNQRDCSEQLLHFCNEIGYMLGLNCI